MEGSLLEYESGVKVSTKFKEDLRRTTYEKHMGRIENWMSNGEDAEGMLPNITEGAFTISARVRVLIVLFQREGWRYISSSSGCHDALRGAT